LEAELEGGLVGGQPEVGEQVAGLLFGGVDDLPGRGSVDRRGYVRAELLELTAQLLEQILGRKLGLVIHRGALRRGSRGRRAQRRHRTFHRRI
jgi:hypothetical protein